MTDCMKLLAEARSHLYHHGGCAIYGEKLNKCSCGVGEVRDRIDALLKSGGWVSVEESLPDEGQECALITDFGNVVGYRREGWSGGFCTQNNGGGSAITQVRYFLCLPPLPQENGRSDG